MGINASTSANAAGERLVNAAIGEGKTISASPNYAILSACIVLGALIISEAIVTAARIPKQ